MCSKLLTISFLFSFHCVILFRIRNRWVNEPVLIEELQCTFWLIIPTMFDFSDSFFQRYVECSAQLFYFLFIIFCKFTTTEAMQKPLAPDHHLLAPMVSEGETAQSLFEGGGSSLLAEKK